VRGCQWPLLAVRRFMLYNVLLHELGHLQVIDERARSTRRRFASETLAEDFAEHWCHELWSRRFEHPDPVHNPPSNEETANLRDGWIEANGHYKKGLLEEKAKAYEAAVAHYTEAIESYPTHALALERLGALSYGGMGTVQSDQRAVELLESAVRLDPASFDANIYLALALGRVNREAEARSFFERAIALDPWLSLATAMYADTIANWGYFAEAEALFRKAIKRDPTCALAIRDYARCLIRDHNPDADKNFGRATELFERAVAVDPRDAQSHYYLGNALTCVEGEEVRGIGHLKTALKIDPSHAKAAAILAEIEAERESPDEG
jgi:tetratricopeptide (TPR) repeat protein